MEVVETLRGLMDGFDPFFDSTAAEETNEARKKALAAIVDDAKARWDILDAVVIHRVGELAPADQIVLVGVTSAHRGDAFAACEFIMDYLKTRAPFWKKESTPEGVRWVDARTSDDEAAARWSVAPRTKA